MTDPIQQALDALAAKACHHGDCSRHDCVKVREAIAALVNYSTLQQTHVLVPIEPTGSQIMFGIHCLEKNDDLPDIGYGPKALAIYKAMIAARPKGV